MNNKKRKILTCLLLTLILCLTGCSGLPFMNSASAETVPSFEGVPDSLQEEGEAAGNTVILTAPVADAALSPDVYEGFIRSALVYNNYTGSLSVVRVDGDARLMGQGSLREMDASRSRIMIDKSVNKAVSSLAAVIRDLRAQEPELDLMKGFFMAGSLLRGMDGTRTVLVDSNGLSSAGALNLTGSNILEIDTKKLIEDLREAKALPDMSGLKIVWVNMGLVPGDAKDQKELSETMKSWLRDFYEALLVEGCGAESVKFYDHPAVGGEKALQGDLPHKTPVEVYREEAEIPMLPEDELNSTSFTISESKVSFRPDYAEFALSEEEVCENLKDLIGALKEHPGYHVVIAGGTSSFGRQESSIELSRKRAEKIRDLLTGQGVLPDQIEGVYGLGYREDSPIYTNDRVNGELVESLAARNRIVVVAGINSDLAGKIIKAGEKEVYQASFNRGYDEPQDLS